MQAVSVTPNLVIPAGAKVFGKVTGAQPTSQTGSSLSLRFDHIMAKKREIPMTVGLRAVASYMEVNDAHIPQTGPDEGGMSALSWTTVQVGGDIVYGTGGPVMAGATEMGRGVPGGVVARLTATPGSECAGGWPSSSQLQSLWVFASGACGVYGFQDLTIRHAGKTPPLGVIVLSSSRKTLRLTRGSGLLLQEVGDSR
jgi:hypothetical protein